jgi:hypothetical protein
LSEVEIPALSETEMLQMRASERIAILVI